MRDNSKEYVTKITREMLSQMKRERQNITDTGLQKVLDHLHIDSFDEAVELCKLKGQKWFWDKMAEIGYYE